MIRPDLKLITDDKPPRLDAYATIPAGARLRIDAVASKLRPLQTTFAGNFATTAKIAEAGPAIDQIMLDLRVLRRLLP